MRYTAAGCPPSGTKSMQSLCSTLDSCCNACETMSLIAICHLLWRHSAIFTCMVTLRGASISSNVLAALLTALVGLEATQSSTPTLFRSHMAFKPLALKCNQPATPESLLRLVRSIAIQGERCHPNYQVDSTIASNWWRPHQSNRGALIRDEHIHMCRDERASTDSDNAKVLHLPPMSIEVDLFGKSLLSVG